MYAWMRLIRINNILIAWITGFVVYYFFVWHMIYRYDLSQSLDYPGMIILMICLGAVMAGGYIINNILDIKTDKINATYNPISRGEISISSAFNLYLILLIAGTVLAIWQSVRIDRQWLSILFPVMFTVMYFYSSRLKHVVFWGNCLIATACGALPLLFLIAEWPAFVMLKNIHVSQFGFHLSIMLFFSIFMFLVTLIREIIKDLEDIEGDQTQGSHTLPVVLGIQNTIIIVDMLLLLLMGTLVFWSYYIFENLTVFNIFTSLFPIVTIILIVHRNLYKKQDREVFSRASLLLKVLMIFGLLHLIILSYNV